MEVQVRERGVQSRRAKAAESGSNPTGSPPAGGPGYWPALAIIAVIIATAGWTTVGVLVLNDNRTPAASVPTESEEPLGEGELPPEEEPVPESHTFPDLEALLPAEFDGTPLDVQSFSGEEFIFDDPWGTSMTAFLTSIGKTPADLQIGQASDPDAVLDLDVILAFRIAGVEPEALRDAVINGWREEFPALTTSTVTIADKAVTSGLFEEETPPSLWYVHDGIVFEVESGDQELAARVIAALPPASAAVPSAAPSVAPSASPAS